MPLRPVLKSFQSLSRIEQLATDGVLLASWEHVPKGWEVAYRAMVEGMALGGIECGGRPPMWAWSGPATWGTAFGLLGDRDVALGYGTVTFTPPPELVFYSDYEMWCDSLTTGDWAVSEGAEQALHRGRDVVVQATLPRIELDWVCQVVPLPTHDIYALDWGTPV